MSLAVIVPTFNNPQQLHDTLMSLVRNTDFAGRIIVVNNGAPGNGYYEQVQGSIPHEIDWIEPGKNLGWMGAINLALPEVQTEWVCMLNDDVLFPPASFEFWQKLTGWFDRTDIGGVGPTSNFVAGHQSAFMHGLNPRILVPFLIGFCALYRTKVLHELGGLDESLPGGDDLDLSIRVKDAGWMLACDRRVYLHHIGQQTGHRVHPGEWDSQKHQADTYNALIRKHGLKRWYELMTEKALSVWAAEARGGTVENFQRARFDANDPLRTKYLQGCVSASDIGAHLPVLYKYASGCKTVVEFGVNDCTSTAAFLYAQPDELHSYDIIRFPEVDEMEKIAGRTRFTFHEQSTLDADIPECDLLFIDDLHTGEHVRQELARHAGKVRKYIFAHDTTLFANAGELPGSEGVWSPFADFLRESPDWRLLYTTEECNGLVGLVRA